VGSRRDEAWHDALIATYWKEVVRVLGRRLGGYAADVDDLAQKVFLTAWEKRSAVPDEPRAWLFATAVHHAFNHLRACQRQPTLLYEPIDVADTTISESSICAAMDLRRAWEQLTPDEQAMIQFAHLHELDSSQIAAIVGSTAQAVRKRLARIRRKLQAELEGPSLWSAPDPPPDVSWDREST